MPGFVFSLGGTGPGGGDLGVYGNKTALETPGPGSYDAFPFLNPPMHATRRPHHFPDRRPGFVNVIGGRQKWRPEPMSVSRMQSEQPLVHYASATFWDWPEQKRRSHSAFRSTDGGAPRRGSGASSGWGDFDGGMAMPPATDATRPQNSFGRGGAAASSLPGLSRSQSQPAVGMRKTGGFGGM
mmetsp:Transcript_19444/g.58334  ORF Transcript_19444/g.58334 Transcript_19444/m.58334 type:complete len:183 (+) Transcript_19444:163-711(+)